MSICRWCGVNKSVLYYLTAKLLEESECVCQFFNMETCDIVKISKLRIRYSYYKIFKSIILFI